MPVEPIQRQKYTYADYLTWNDGNRYELIDGEVYMMAPTPSPAHQEISGEVFRQLANYLKGKSCKVFSAPFDVRLNADDADDTVVQPDISVICDPKKIDARGCKGAPDLIIEILSPSTANYDRGLKLDRYLKAGVREYWVVDPQTRSVQVNLLKDSGGTFRRYYPPEMIPVHVLEDCSIDLAEVFPAGEA